MIQKLKNLNGSWALKSGILTAVFLFLGFVIAKKIRLDVAVYRPEVEEIYTPTAVSTLKLVLLSLFLAGLFFLFLFLWEKISRHRNLIIVLAILIPGIVITFLSPVCMGYDEAGHFFKTISTLNGKTVVYDSYNGLISVSFRQIINEGRRFSVFSEALRGPWSSELCQMDAVNGMAQNTYPPYAYIFCCIGAGIGILTHAPVGMVFWLSRFFNLLGFCVLVYLSLQILPEERSRFRNGLMTVALMPVVVYICSHCTQDTVFYGLVLLIAALFIRIHESGEVKISMLVLLGALLFLLGPVKYPYIVFLGFLFLLPAKHFPQKKCTVNLVKAAIILLTCLFTAVWFLFVSSQFHEARVEGVDVSGQIRFIIAHPLRFVFSVLYSLANDFQSFILYSYEVSTMPFYWTSSILAWCGFVVHLFSFVFLSGRHLQKRAGRCWVLLMVSAGVILTCFALYASWTAVGAGLIGGLQGRYFAGFLICIPLMLPANRFALSEESTDRAAKLVFPFEYAVLLLYMMGFGIFL